jgi:hypothetical protein
MERDQRDSVTSWKKLTAIAEALALLFVFAIISVTRWKKWPPIAEALVILVLFAVTLGGVIYLSFDGP